jgi:photosystem II stability/assembly factor-like uncharacterized protein
MKNIFLYFAPILALCNIGLSQNLVAPRPDRPEMRTLAEQSITQDPKTKQVPYNELQTEIVKMAIQRKNGRQKAAVPGVTWQERGPLLGGGRTRVLVFDPNDSQNRKAWAGSVSGGLWYNNDLTDANSSWQKVDDFWENLAVTALYFDPSNPQIAYVGTGEGLGNIDAVWGGGLWKTTNGGSTWTRLASTVPNYFGSLTSVAYAFTYVYDVVVNASGEIFVATVRGVLKSADGGATWTRVLVPSESIGATNNAGLNADNRATDLEIASDGVLYAGFRNSQIFKSTNAGGTTWSNISPILAAGTTGRRTEIGLAYNTSGATQELYAVSGHTSFVFFKKSNDAGSTWTDVPQPNYADFASQFWYDLILAVHPTRPDTVFLGGTTYARSFNGGRTWKGMNYWSYGHPDQHILTFRPQNHEEVYWANDGGVYYSAQMTDSTVVIPNALNRNKNYATYQFYSAAARNVAGHHFFIGGTQDRGTMSVNAPATSNGTRLQGGDGMLCFIDQDEPNVVIASYQYNNYLLRDSVGVWRSDLITDNDGYFINGAEYDWKNNVLFATKGYDSAMDSSFFRVVENVGTTNLPKRLMALKGNFSNGSVGAVMCTGYAPNTLFLGSTRTSGRKIFRVTNAHTRQPILTDIDGGQLPSGGSVSCIELGASDNEILVTLSNYSVKSVWYTSDGGTTWASKDESTHGLPNIPVRSAIFNPNDRRQVLLATELGVWSSNDITANNPGWEISSNQLAMVRCDMLKYRNADGLVLVGTHGRGFFTSTVFQKSQPTYAVRSGNWHSANTWATGVVPTSTDQVAIGRNHTVTVQANASAKSLDLRGLITFLNGFSLQLFP